MSDSSLDWTRFNWLRHDQDPDFHSGVADPGTPLTRVQLQSLARAAAQVRPDETRVVVDGLMVPPYEDATAYVRREDGVYGIRYENGRTDWFRDAHQAFGEAEITLHPCEED